jgi:hypothetical protein
VRELVTEVLREAVRTRVVDDDPRSVRDGRGPPGLLRPRVRDDRDEDRALDGRVERPRDLREELDREPLRLSSQVRTDR